ncbi:MAG: hypothetical protein L3K04_02130 [Thermoplasmata archaeon]|nr:hypothetical protein [Thermoplasmata archaeon]
MPLAAPGELEAVARLGGAERHDAASQLSLERAVEEYLPRRRAPLAPFNLEVDGASYSTGIAALLAPAASFKTATLRLPRPPGDASEWEYLHPFTELRLLEDGSAVLQGETQVEERGIARLLLREQFVPLGGARAAGALRPGLFSLAEFAAFVRATGTVPFGVALAVYFTEERVRYDLDFLDDLLLPDQRAGRLRPQSRVRRSPRFSHAVDSLVSRGELSLPSARALEAIVESHGLTVMDLAPLFSGVRELGNSALYALLSRRLVTFDRRTGVYRPRLEAFLSATDRLRSGGEAPLRPLVDPHLRSSVAELQAAADSRASCPLCGEPLAPGHRGLLCENCERKVEAPTSTHAP